MLEMSVALTFVIVLFIVMATFWVLLFQPEQDKQMKLRKRLKVAVGSRQARDRILKAIVAQDRTKRDPAAIPPVKSLRSLSQLVEQSGLRLSVSGLLAICAAVGVVVFVAAYRVTDVVPIGLAAAAVTCVLPVFYVSWVRTRRVHRFEEFFPEAIDLISRSLRAGHAFTTGLAMVAEEIPDPVGIEFRLLYDQQNYGMPMAEGLKSFAARIPSLDARFFVTAVLTQREAGGNLAEVLDNLATVIRDRFRVKRQIRVISAHGRLSGAILSLMPPGLAAFFMLSSPDTYKILFTDPLGIQMIIVAIVLQVVGMLVIRKIVNVEY